MLTPLVCSKLQYYKSVARMHAHDRYVTNVCFGFRKVLSDVWIAIYETVMTFGAVSEECKARKWETYFVNLRNLLTK